MFLTPLILILSLVVDRALGDPHSRFHPVALIGSFIGWWGQPLRWSPALQRSAGVVFWIITIIIFTIPFCLFSAYAPWFLMLFAGPFLLKICFALRSLEEHAAAVAAATSPDAGREKVQMLVSRDTSALTDEQILSAAYESVAENLNDSIIAPLFYFIIFGLPGAACYRAANTMDAMVGYTDERVRIGWFSARMDDILSYIPGTDNWFSAHRLLHLQKKIRPCNQDYETGSQAPSWFQRGDSDVPDCRGNRCDV